MYSTRKKHIVLLALLMMLALLLLSACGNSLDKDFATYMKGQPAMRGTIDAQLAIINAEAKGSVQYVDDKAEITIDYYALTQSEIDELEVQRIMKRCSVIMNDAVEQYKADTGKTATVEVTIFGSDAGKKL